MPLLNLNWIFFGNCKCDRKKFEVRLYHIHKSCLSRHWLEDSGRLTSLLSAAAAQTVSDAAADAAADAADQGEDQRGHHRRDDRPEPPDGLAGAVLALGHHVGARGGRVAGPSVEFGKSLGDGILGIIVDLCSVIWLVISEQVSGSGCKKSFVY